MALSERLAYILDFDVKGAVKGLEKVGSTADKELGKAEKKLDKLSGNLTKFGAGAVAFAGVTGVALIKMGQGAAEAEANTAALRQVVDELSATQIEEWAEDSAKAVGLASKEAIAATTGFAGLGKIIDLSGPDLASFSTELVEMAADMAAFKDVSPQQALQDLQSLFAGSTEVGRKYNIFLDDATLKSAYFRETGEKVSGTLTAQQRIIATNSELYRQGADMIGQWGRESDQLAGQTATLKANLTNLSDQIGAGVLPMMTKMVGVAADAAGGLAKVDGATAGAVGKFAALGTGGIALLGTLSLVAGQVIKMRDRFTDLAADGTRSLNNMGKAARGLGVALGVAAAALAVYSANQASNNRDMQTSIGLMDELGRAADKELAGGFAAALIFAKTSGEDLDDTMARLARSNIESARRLIETGAAADVSAEAAEKLEQAIANEEKARKQQITTNEDYGDSVDEVTESTNTSYDAIGRARIQQQDYVRGLLAAGEANKDVAESTDELTDAIADLRDEIDDAFNSALEYEESTIDLDKAVVGLAKQEEATAKVIADSESTVDDKRDALYELREAQIDVAKKAIDTSLAFVAEQGAGLDSTAQAALQRAELERLREKYGDMGPEIDAYIAKLSQIPREINTNVRLSGGRIGATNASGQVSSFRYGNGPVGLADGGIVKARPGGTLALIGEGGQDEAVIPIDRTSGGSSSNGRAGSTYTINVNAGMGTDGNAVGREVVEAIKRFERANGKGWRS